MSSQSMRIRLDALRILLRNFLSPRTLSSRIRKVKGGSNHSSPMPVTEVGNHRLWLETYVKAVTIFSGSRGDRLVSWFRHVSRSVEQAASAPKKQDGQMVFQPRAILVAGYAACGQIARVFIDGANVLGFDTRLLQLKNHVVGEVFLENEWRLFDPDLNKSGFSYVGRDGRPATLKTILEGKTNFNELRLDLVHSKGMVDEVFAHQNALRSYANSSNIAYVKVESADTCLGQNFGWDNYETTFLQRDT